MTLANYKSVFVTLLVNMSKTPCRFKQRLECKTDLCQIWRFHCLAFNYQKGRLKKKKANIAGKQMRSVTAGTAMVSSCRTHPLTELKVLPSTLWFLPEQMTHKTRNRLLWSSHMFGMLVSGQSCLRLLYSGVLRVLSTWFIVNGSERDKAELLRGRPKRDKE